MTKNKLTAEASFIQQINSNIDTNQDKYYLPSDFKQIKMDVKNNLNFFHLNITTLPYRFPELHTLLATSEIELDITGIKESRLKSNKSHLTNTTLPNYNIEHCPTEGPNDGTHLYTTGDIIYKKRNDQKFSKAKCLNQFSLK